MSEDFDSLTHDHGMIFLVCVVSLCLSVVLFATTREQIQGLPQERPIVEELHCPNGPARVAVFGADGSTVAKCEDSQ